MLTSNLILNLMEVKYVSRGEPNSGTHTLSQSSKIHLPAPCLSVVHCVWDFGCKCGRAMGSPSLSDLRFIIRCVCVDNEKPDKLLEIGGQRI